MNIGIEYDYEGYMLTTEWDGLISESSANSSRRSRDGRRQHFKGTTQGVRLQGDVISPKMSYNRVLPRAMPLPPPPLLAGCS